VKLLKTTRKVQ